MSNECSGAKEIEVKRELSGHIDETERQFGKLELISKKISKIEERLKGTPQEVPAKSCQESSSGEMARFVTVLERSDYRLEEICKQIDRLGEIV